ncbi:MAG: molybdenum cofactor biosynthesis protein MoaE [Sphingobium sp.]
MIRVAVQGQGFDPGAELAALEGLGGGGIASFTGIVRADGGISALHLDHYPAMTLGQMERVAAEAAARWPLLGLTIIHRYGTLAVGERIVFVGAASVSRVPALEACAYLIDWLKVAAPFWKREVHADGSGAWVEAKAADDSRAARWQKG